MKRHRRIALVAAAIVAVAVTLLSWLGLTLGTFQSLQPRLVDSLFPAVAADPGIAVVLIDDKSLAEVGQWPWDRSVHAELIRKLDEAGAERIGYDVTFPEPSDDASDRQLAQAIDDAGNVVLAALAQYRGRVRDVPVASTLGPPIPVLRRAALAIGHVSVFPDQADGVVRTLAPVIGTPDDRFLPSMSLTLTLDDPTSDEYSLGTTGVRTLGGTVPTGPGHLMDINFAESFRTYSAIDVMRDEVPDDAFDDAVVLVGASALALGDSRLTPLDKATGQPGVLIHANALNTMLNGAYLKPDPTGTSLLLVLAVALLVALGVSYPPVWATPFAPIVALIGFGFLAFRRFDSGAVTNLVYPLLAIGLSAVLAIGTRYFTELRERRRVTKLFGRYLSQDVVEEVLAAPGEAVATLEGVSPEISVLFADLRGFTSASEQLPPRTVVSALNVFLDAMTRGVLEERGTIDKFMGDCVMAFWNAPRPESRHAECAIRAALRMQKYIGEAMEKGDVAYLPVRGCGVGIATGEAVVGNIGSADRLDYTVIGDTVNTASRLCGVAEAGEVVITEACAEQVRDTFDLVPLPPISVKGKEEPLRVFRVSERGDADALIENAVVPDESLPAPDKAGGYAPIEPTTELDAAGRSE